MHLPASFPELWDRMERSLAVSAHFLPSLYRVNGKALNRVCLPADLAQDEVEASEA